MSDGSDGSEGGDGTNDIDQDDEFLKSIQKLYERNSPTGITATLEDMNEGGDEEKVFIHGSKAPRTRRLWTYEEDLRIVDALYLHGPKWRKIAQLLQLGSDDAVRNRVLRMKVYKLPNKVQQMVMKLQEKRLALYPNWSGKSGSNAYHKGDANAPPSASSPRPWTLEEDNLIRRYLEAGPQRSAWQTLHESYLPHRTRHAIRNRAGRIGLVEGSFDLRRSECNSFVSV